MLEASSSSRNETRTGVRESVYFYTLHKCASSLFGRYVLKNVRGLTHVNFASLIYRGQDVEDLSFEKTGHVYGPIRVTTESPSADFRRLTAILFSRDFVRDKPAVFLVRDPRDIIVSSYYWRIHNPGISRASEIAERQRERREAIQQQTVDEYSLEHAERLLTRLTIMADLQDAAERGVLLKYEDMINNWETFAGGLTRYLDLSPSVLAEVHDRSRPRQSEEQTSHHRSGKTGGFRDKLRSTTIDAINETLAPVLSRFQYEVS